MKLNPQEFAQRGRETARLLREALAARRVVERFVDSYAAEFDRSGLRESPLRYRELLLTISREAWLALISRAEALLMGRLSPQGRAPQRGPEATAVDAFREALLDELGAAQHWMPSDRDAFARDLILYAQISARQPRVMRARPGVAVAEGAFVDRCALLLDPSLFDKARAAAGKLLLQLDALAEETLSEILPAPPSASRPSGKMDPRKKGSRKKKPARKR